MKDSSTVRVALIDRRSAIRAGIALLLRQEPDIVVTEEADTLDSLHSLSNADVAVFHPRLQYISSSDWQERAGSSGAETLPGIIYFLDDNQRHFIRPLIESGARGVVASSSDISELIRAIRRVHEGESYYCSSCIQTMTQILRPRRSGIALPDELSRRQQELLSLLCSGLEAKQAAVELGLSVKTVEFHRRKLLERIDGRGTADLVLYAIRYGLIPFTVQST